MTPSSHPQGEAWIRNRQPHREASAKALSTPPGRGKQRLRPAANPTLSGAQRGPQAPGVGAPRGRGPCGVAAAPPAPRTRPVHDGNRIRPFPEKSRFQCSTLLFFQRQYFYDVIQSGACSAVVRLGRAVGCCASAQNPSAPHVAATALLACSRRRTPQPRPARHRHLVGPSPASPSPPAPAHPATTVLFSASVSWFLPQRDFLKHVLIFQKHTQKPTKTRDALSRPPSSEH